MHSTTNSLRCAHTSGSRSSLSAKSRSFHRLRTMHRAWPGCIWKANAYLSSWPARRRRCSGAKRRERAQVERGAARSTRLVAGAALALALAALATAGTLGPITAFSATAPTGIGRRRVGRRSAERQEILVEEVLLLLRLSSTLALASPAKNREVRTSTLSNSMMEAMWHWAAPEDCVHSS